MLTDTVGGKHVECNLPDRPAVNAACLSAVDNDGVACTLPCGPAANAAFAWSEAVTRMEAKRIPKRENASLLDPGLQGRCVAPRKDGPICIAVMKEKASILSWYLGTYLSDRSCRFRNSSTDNKVEVVFKHSRAGHPARVAPGEYVWDKYVWDKGGEYVWIRVAELQVSNF